MQSPPPLAFLYSFLLFADIGAAAAAAAAAPPPPPPTRLRVEYLGASPLLALDTPRPRFSWALPSLSSRAQAQAAYRLTVTRAFPPPRTLLWDSGVVASNRSANVGFGGAAPLEADADFELAVQWAAAAEPDTLSAPATAAFSTGLLAEADFGGAQWLGSGSGGGGGGGGGGDNDNAFRAEFTLPAAPARARLYMTALGYGRASLNGVRIGAEELGQFVVFRQRVLYDAFDVQPLLGAGCNALGLLLGHGWWAQPTIDVAGPGGPNATRQFRLALSLAFEDGSRMLLVSSPTSSSSSSASSFSSTPLSSLPLLFTSAAGPVLADDIYLGERFDGRIALAQRGFDACSFNASAGWRTAEAPALTPATLGAASSARLLPITTERDFAPANVSAPLPGILVFDFLQNAAGQTTLNLSGCVEGTVVTVTHGELLKDDGSVFNQFAPHATQTAMYTCHGAGGPPPPPPPPPPPQGNATCVAGLAEGGSAHLACGAPGATFSAVDFASFGTPRGTCAAGNLSLGSCHAANSASVVAAACLGRASCEVSSDRKVFAPDPCLHTPKWLDVALTCSAASNGVAAAAAAAHAINDTVEVYRPLFTYFGFRYAQVEGFGNASVALTAHFVHSDVPQTGAFGSASPLLNGVQSALRFASLSNLYDVPTDCPQRERRGWLGDAQVSAPAVLANFEPAHLYGKYLRDIADVQADNRLAPLSANGSISDTAPWYHHGIEPAEPGWGYALFALTADMRDVYDDSDIVARMFPACAAFAETWIALAERNGHALPVTVSQKLHGDWGNYARTTEPPNPPPPPTAHRPPPTAHRPPPTVHRPPPTAHRPPPTTHSPY